MVTEGGGNKDSGRGLRGVRGSSRGRVSKTNMAGTRALGDLRVTRVHARQSAVHCALDRWRWLSLSTGKHGQLGRVLDTMPGL